MSNKPPKAPSRAPSSSTYKTPASVSGRAFGTYISAAPGSVRPSQAPLPASVASAAVPRTIVPKPKSGATGTAMPPQPTSKAPGTPPRSSKSLQSSATTVSRAPPTLGFADIPTTPAAGGASSAAPGPTAMRSMYTDPEDLRRATLQSHERSIQDRRAKVKADAFAPLPRRLPLEKDMPTPKCPGYVCEGRGVPGLYVMGSWHEDLANMDCKPTKEEKVPPRSTLDLFAYCSGDFDLEVTMKTDPAIKSALDWDL
ncbi:hypothetical protein F5Y19DRAFT_468865 [Xylariaceae sp. FL1651]|nr:hypothetical protein F5Y19DRAFT_468865 [Xylariaceae sp. FL1651]